jgi:hypothetical protein
MRDKEVLASGSRQHGDNLFCTEAISVGFNDSGANGRLRLFLKEPVVLRDGSQINSQYRACAVGSRRRRDYTNPFKNWQTAKLHVGRLKG